MSQRVSAVHQAPFGYNACAFWPVHADSAVISGITSGVINGVTVVSEQNSHFDPKKRASFKISDKTDKFRVLSEIRV